MKYLLIAVLMAASFNTNAQQIQFFTLEAGCKMEIWQDRSGEKPVNIQRTERLGANTPITEGVWNVQIKCTAAVSMLVQITGKVPMKDVTPRKVWNLSIVPLPNETYIFTPYAETRCFTSK